MENTDQNNSEYGHFLRIVQNSNMLRRGPTLYDQTYQKNESW